MINKIISGLIDYHLFCKGVRGVLTSGVEVHPPAPPLEVHNPAGTKVLRGILKNTTAPSSSVPRDVTATSHHQGKLKYSNAEELEHRAELIRICGLITSLPQQYTADHAEVILEIHNVLSISLSYYMNNEDALRANGLQVLGIMLDFSKEEKFCLREAKRLNIMPFIGRVRSLLFMNQDTVKASEVIEVMISSAIKLRSVHLNGILNLFDVDQNTQGGAQYANILSDMIFYLFKVYVDTASKSSLNSMDKDDLDKFPALMQRVMKEEYDINDLKQRLSNSVDRIFAGCQRQDSRSKVLQEHTLPGRMRDIAPEREPAKAEHTTHLPTREPRSNPQKERKFEPVTRTSGLGTFGKKGFDELESKVPTKSSPAKQVVTLEDCARNHQSLINLHSACKNGRADEDLFNNLRTIIQSDTLSLINSDCIFAVVQDLCLILDGIVRHNICRLGDHLMVIIAFIESINYTLGLDIGNMDDTKHLKLNGTELTIEQLHSFAYLLDWDKNNYNSQCQDTLHIVMFEFFKEYMFSLSQNSTDLRSKVIQLCDICKSIKTPSKLWDKFGEFIMSNISRFKVLIDPELTTLIVNALSRDNGPPPRGPGSFQQTRFADPVVTSYLDDGGPEDLFNVGGRRSLGDSAEY